MRKETHGFARFELVLNVLRLCPLHLKYQRVLRIVVAATRVQGKPAQAAPYLALHSHVLRMPLKLFALAGIFHLQEPSL